MDQDHPTTGPEAGAQGAPTGGAATGETPETPTTAGATRSQHVVHTLPHDWGTIPQFLGPALERLDPAAADVQLLVVTPDADTALAVADAALHLRGAAAGTPILAVTRVERAGRQLRARPAPAAAADPAALAGLLRASALKLDAVRFLVLAWADEILDLPNAEDLDLVLGEVSKEAERTLVATQVTDDVEALIERALRRPRRVAPQAASGAPLAVSYVPTATSARPSTLRRVLDELDPPTATIVVASPSSEAEVRRAVRVLGYALDDAGAAAAPADDVDEAQRALGLEASAPAARVRIARVDDATPFASQEALVVLYDLPVARDLRGRLSAARPVQVVALPQPRQLPALRELGAGAPRPLALKDVARREDARDSLLRAALLAELSRGLPARELRVLEELLETHDGVEAAAIAVRLLERERARRQTQAPSAPAAAAQPAAAPPAAMTRLFITIGTRDGARPGDLVGAISNEAGITSDRIGKIELRESFSLVEVAGADAARVIEKVSGIMIRGRKVQVRAERETRGGGGDRPPRGDRPERGERRG
ncbi:DEAD/DEAH box helicase, partial [Roseisolibacter sp. H3M3-2]|uniref:DEAD/DEAH box helicase n=1 Tax=Roseisolibacter sp. H3M3-2 TaxID=3031323 RepID=UPI0023DC66E9